ncbi:hypothetical protein [Polaribacter atrinae]|uniref:hypothetical protein n=1 Tax=Polaribacter atrinae TaxID=1333662 RepID=UPI0024916AF7|nr:hypothetical protein [Polaribacter atrinae]
MESVKIRKETKLLWEFTVNLAIALCYLLEQDKSYKNIRLLFQNGKLSIGSNFKNQIDLLYPITCETSLKSLWINANNPKDIENTMQIQVVLHFQPQLENTVCVVWKTDEQFNFSLQDDLDANQLAQDIFVKIKSKFTI